MCTKKPEYQEMTKALGYAFRNIFLLEEALRHSSYVNEQPDRNLKSNERLEFLGDAVLNLAIGHLLMVRHEDINEGALSKMRAGLVNETQIAEISRRIHLGEIMQLGKGEAMSGGGGKQSILADALEAVIAAVYLDGGYHEAFRIVERLFGDDLNAMDTDDITVDHKSRLQELVQLQHIEMPEYTIVEETGPDHDKTFTVGLDFDGALISGTGKSKKAAEQEAARNAYKTLKKRLDPS